MACALSEDSAWASAQSVQSSLSPWRKLGSLAIHSAHSESLSDWADAQTDLSLCWAHMLLCWFCHEVAHIYSVSCCSQLLGNYQTIQTNWHGNSKDIIECPNINKLSQEQNAKAILIILLKHSTFLINQMRRNMTKPTKWVCAQWRLRSALASAQSDQSLRCALNG